MDNSASQTERRNRQFSLRLLLIVFTIASLFLGLVSYIRMNIPRWRAEAVNRRAERQKIDAEKERIEQADMKDGQQLIADLEVIHKKLGRYPNDEAELVSIRGKPMPMNGTRSGRVPIEYRKDEDGKHYGLIYRW
jgi:hypothetical protein